MLSLDMVLSSFRDLEPFLIHWKRGFQVQFSPELVVPGEPWHFWELNFDMGKNIMRFLAQYSQTFFGKIFCHKIPSILEYSIHMFLRLSLV